MPKIRDLGINGIPETMRPPEIGDGGGGKGSGGGGDCEGATHECPAGTLQNTLSGGCYGDAAGTCTAGTRVNTLNTCYGGYAAQCTAGTLNNTGNTCYGYAAQCTAGTLHNTDNTCFRYAGQCPAGTLHDTLNTCWCPAGTLINTLNTCKPYEEDPNCTAGTLVTTPHIVRLTAAQTGQPAAAGLTREAIELLKKQLHQQIAQLDELAKSIGPNTAEEIDTREQQLKAELEELANRRNRLTTTTEE